MRKTNRLISTPGLLLVVLVILLASSCQPAVVPPAVPPIPDTGTAAGLVHFPIIRDARYLAQIRVRVGQNDPSLMPAVAVLRRDADGFLKAGPFSVMNKKNTAPNGDKHEYLSIEVYSWPDPASPDGRPYIMRDGELNPGAASDLYDASSFKAMIAAVDTLSLGYYLTANEAYGRKAAQLLRTWFIDAATRMNPDLNFAEGLPGKSGGTPSGIIESADLIGLLDAVSLLDNAVWDHSDQQALKSWFTDFLAWLQNSPNGKNQAAARNNHGSWYYAQVIDYSLFLGDTAGPAALFNSKIAELIASQIEPDGRQPLELARTRPLHYTIFNLEAQISLALMGEQVGADMWHFESADGRSLRKALQYLVPFLNGGQFPFKEVGVPSVPGFAPYLREAALRYQDQLYLDVSNRIPASREDRDRLNLLYPAAIGP